MKKQTVRLNDSTLKQIVSESVKKLLEQKNFNFSIPPMPSDEERIAAEKAETGNQEEEKWDKHKYEDAMYPFWDLESYLGELTMRINLRGQFYPEEVLVQDACECCRKIIDILTNGLKGGESVNEGVLGNIF